MAEYIKKQVAISLYKNGDCILRKNESVRQDDDGQIFYVYDEIQFKTDMSFSEIESKFDEVWLLQTKPQEPSESERLEALEMLMVDILGGGF